MLIHIRWRWLATTRSTSVASKLASFGQGIGLSLSFFLLSFSSSSSLYFPQRCLVMWDWEVPRWVQSQIWGGFFGCFIIIVIVIRDARPAPHLFYLSHPKRRFGGKSWGTYHSFMPFARGEREFPFPVIPGNTSLKFPFPSRGIL